MSRDIPIRDQLGTIIGVRPKEEPDHVQATLDASMQAVGAMPEVQPPVPTPVKRPLPPVPSFRLEMIVAAVCLVVVGWTFFPRRTTAPPISIPPTVAPTVTLQPTMTPTNSIPINPRAVTLSAIALYGDYDEATKIGAAPVGLRCTLTGQSPDGLWAYLECPAPTYKVWAKVGALGLSAEQRSAFRDTRIISRIVPTVPTFSPPRAPQGQGPALAFCADRSSIWGKVHQCGPTQGAADALADADMWRINATAVAISKQH